jgi:hypothetical protein
MTRRASGPPGGLKQLTAVQIWKTSGQSGSASDDNLGSAAGPNDLQSILDTILTNATRLRRAYQGALLLFEQNGMEMCRETTQRPLSLNH